MSKKFYGVSEGITKEQIMDLVRDVEPLDDEFEDENLDEVQFTEEDITDEEAQQVANELSGIDPMDEEDFLEERDEILRAFIERKNA